MKIFPFLMARVGGLPVGLLDELAVETAADFEKIIHDNVLLEAERQRVFQKIQEKSRLPELEKSLLFSSHDLLERLPKMQATPPARFVKKQRQTALAVFEYLARACSKTSPLSRLTTVQVIDLQRLSSADEPVFENDEQPFRWADAPVFGEKNDDLKFRQTPNVALAEPLFEELLHDPAFFRQLEIRLNPAIAPPDSSSKNAFHFPFFDGEIEAFQSLTAAPSLLEIWKILAAEPGGSMPFLMFEKQVLETLDATTETLQLVVNQLVSFGFLEFLPPVSGLEPDWSARLHSRLAFFQNFGKQAQVAAHFHWQNGASKLLAWMPTEQVLATQREAAARWAALFSREKPPPAERVWFQDVAAERPVFFEKMAFETLVEALGEAILEAGPPPSSPILERASRFFEAHFSEKTAVGFVQFSHAFFQNQPTAEAFDAPIFSEKKAEPFQKMAAQLQLFRGENGELQAVVNSIFGGGGRLFGRFLPLFSEKITDSLRVWNEATEADELPVAFTGQAWHNAHLMPALTNFELDFHGSRPRFSPEKRVALRDLAVGFDEAERRIFVFQRSSGRRVRLIDLALEAPDSRTPVLQLLRAACGASASSVGWILTSLFENSSEFETTADGVFYPKLVWKNRLVFRRATWVFDLEKLPRRARPTAPESDWLGEIWVWKMKNGLPRWAFFQLEGLKSKPQLVDFQSVISLRLFLKNTAEARGAIFFTEMSPEPSAVLMDGFVSEFVVEFSFST